MCERCDELDAKLAEQPAQPQQACPTCGEYEPKTGTCGTSPNDKRALCNRNAPQAHQQETINGRTVKVDWKAQALELRELVRLGGIKIAELEAELAEQPAQPQEPICKLFGTLPVYDRAAQRKPAQQEPVGALILGGVVDTSDGPEYEEWDIEWNHKAIESLQERLVTHNPVTLNIYTSPPAQQQQKPVTDKENEKFRRDVSNFAGADPEATKYALEEFLKNRTSPPAQRKPLTDEHIDAVRLATGYAAGLERFTAITRAIEAAHGIKENT